MVERLLEAAQVVIDGEFTSQRLHELEILEKGKVFSGILLRLLSNEQCQLKIVQAQCVVK